MSGAPPRDAEMARFTARSASMSIPIEPSFERDEAFISHTGPLVSAPRRGAVFPINAARRQWRGDGAGGGAGAGAGGGSENVHLMRSGPLGLCDNPDCTTCPARRVGRPARRRRDRKVRIFTLMDQSILDSICERLRQKLYIRGTDIAYQGGPVEKMVFIVRGRVESIEADGSIAPLSEGDYCGEELLTWYLEHSTDHKDVGKIQGQRLLSTRTVKCLTNVEAFALTGADLEKVTTLFSRLLRNPRVQGAIRYESPYWRNRAATRIQVGWRYRQWCLKRRSNSIHSSRSNLHRPNVRN